MAAALQAVQVVHVAIITVCADCMLSCLADVMTLANLNNAAPKTLHVCASVTTEV